MPIDLQTLQDTQDFFGFQSRDTVEKDWHVVQAIRAIQAVDATPFELVFAGGTCLARAHRVVERMSEDVDFKVIAGPGAPSSKSGRKAALSVLKGKVCDALRGSGFHFDPVQDVRAQDGNTYMMFLLDYAERQEDMPVLRPKIQIELNFTVLRTPAEPRPVLSLVAEALKETPEVPAITCTGLTETAAEKFVSLTRRTAMLLAGVARNPDTSLIRHLYDLHQIRTYIDLTRFKDLVDDIQKQDGEQFGHQHPAYRDNPVAETAHAITYLATDNQPREDYEKFMKVMVYGTPVAYADTIKVLFALANHGRDSHIIQEGIGSSS